MKKIYGKMDFRAIYFYMFFQEFSHSPMFVIFGKNIEITAPEKAANISSIDTF